MEAGVTAEGMLNSNNNNKVRMSPMEMDSSWEQGEGLGL